MKTLLPLLLALASAGAHASSFCERLPHLGDSEESGGDMLLGRYEIVGKDPLRGYSYAGTLAVNDGQNRYTLVRTINGRVEQGEAWLEACTPDKIRVLFVRYQTQPATEAWCHPRGSLDNYLQLTCKTHQGAEDRTGLESWFQRQ